MNISDTVLFRVDVALRSISSPTGSPTRANFRVETPASIRSITARCNGSRSAVPIGRDRQLVLVVGRPSPWAADRNAPATQRHRPVLVAMPAGCPTPIVLALRADDLGHLGLHQLVHDPQPDTDAQREQTLSRRPDELAERFLNLRRERQL